jgi:hypothetical protein
VRNWAPFWAESMPPLTRPSPKAVGGEPPSAFAFLAVGTAASDDSFTWAPVTVFFFSRLPGVEPFLMVLPLIWVAA